MLRFALLGLLCFCALADQVTLSNGDRLTGKIQKLDGDKLTLVTDMAGPVVIPWKNVGAIMSAQPLYILLKDGRVLSGALVNTREGFRVEKNDARFNIKRDDIVALRSYQEQLRWQVSEERKQAPHLLDPWAGFVDAGISATHGNSDVTTVSLGMNATRTTAHDKLAMTFNSLYSRNSTEDPGSITADLRRGGIRYERNISPKRFGFVSLDAESDAIQQLSLRAVGGAGFGDHWIKTPRTTFDVFGGATINRENYDHLVRLSGEALLSEESSHKLNNIFTLKQKVAVYPNLTDGGQYRVSLDSSAVTTLLRWLSWQVSVSDRYVSNPPVGSKRNDILVTTGLRFNLLPYAPQQPAPKVP